MCSSNISEELKKIMIKTLWKIIYDENEFIRFKKKYKKIINIF